MNFKNISTNDPYIELGRFYDRIIGESYYKRLEALFKRFTSNLPLNSTHFDIGCGTGYLLSVSSKMGFNPQGIDISKSMVEISKKNNPNLKIIMGDFINHKSKYDIITANNDVLNHLKQSVGLDATFSHIYNMLNDDGIFFSDAVSSFDILNNWENCNHILSDNKSFKCEISHKVTDRSLPIGEMYRNWSFKIGKQWLHKKVEIERVIGISPDELMVASKINNFLPKLFNWHLDKNIEDDTSRIGILFKKKRFIDR